MVATNEPSKEAAITRAAFEAFMRYGFKRVTMEDIARGAGISRPAVYLSFNNKEEILRAVLADQVALTLDRVHAAISAADGLANELGAAFESWTIDGYRLMHTNPDARDLVDCTLEFAADIMEDGYRSFERIVASLLQAHARADADASHIEQIARTLVLSGRGIKELVAGEDELRATISTLIDMAVSAV
ncbi:MAG: helix-turn-helix domain-containing protein [Myxococcota bacterium]